MSRRTMTLAVLGAMAALVFAFSSVAWAQTTCPPSNPDCFPEEEEPPPPPNAAPVTTSLSPKAGSKTPDTTPLIKARIRDGSGELRASDIRLFVDGKAKSFKYVAGRTDLLSASPKLGRGRHTVRIVATARLGKSAAKSWAFAVVKRR